MPRSLRQYVRLTFLSLSLFAMGSLTACKFWTIRPIESKGQKTTTPTQAFNADSYVDSIWDSKVGPTVTEKAIDLATLLTALEANVDEAKKQYGVREGDGPVHFIVKGEGAIVRANQSSPHRTIIIRLTKYTGQTEVTMQIGPVFRGTALRDALGFIKFTEFTNQLQYAEVSTKLHERVTRKVVQEIDPHPGERVSFHAVFTLNEREKIMLTPVKLEWGGKG